MLSIIRYCGLYTASLINIVNDKSSRSDDKFLPFSGFNDALLTPLSTLTTII